MTRTLLLATALLATAACSDGSNNEAVGTLAVYVTTGGTADPNGYTVSLEGQPDRAMASTDTTFYVGLPIGNYNVTLSGAEVGCTIVDGPDRNKYVAVGGNSLVYQVTCP